jgi:transcriptional regulator with XRE-family HTH domain
MNIDQITSTVKVHEAAEAGVAQRLRALRIAKGLTQSQLAELAGTNQAVIQKIENGKSIRPRCIAALAVALVVNPAWLAWGDRYALPDVPA